ncbi:blue copper protein-like [Gossypium australe]|uniref:Blue copper protein-like n=1 Tax=Gossypium australe TaxID=47621 RepID=A0A5B6UAM1_9ROSI|nr:blue copper protein-like [Gossypium australe]
MASSSVGMVCLLLVSCMVVPSLAKVYTVGDTSGWTTGVDYSTWTKDKTFKVGDSLVFNYPTSHTVDEVSSSDYSTCTVGNAITTDNSGATTVALKTAGTHYFICGVVGHCANGMKLSVKVESGSSAAPSKSPSKSPSSSSSSSPASTDKPSTGTPSTTTTTTKAPDSSSSWSLPPFTAVVTTCLALLVFVIS